MSEGAIEAVARAIAVQEGCSPDDWRHFTEQAQAAITAHLAWLEANGFAVVPPDVLQFLMGTAPLEGVWFGERHPTRKCNFWWRKVIRERALIAAAKATPK